MKNGRLWALATAAGCAAFYFLAIYAQHRFSGGYVQFLIHADNRQAWLPQFMTGYDRFWRGGLFSTDLLTVGGSSIFGLRANLPVLYPPLVFSYLFFDVSNLETAVIVMSLIVIAHVFVGAYATFRIAEALPLSKGIAAFAAVSYVTSITLIRYLDFLPFFFQAMLLPVIVHVLIKIVDGAPRASSLAAPALISYALTDYAPMMAFGALTGLWMTIVLVKQPVATVVSRLAKAAIILAPALPFIGIYYVGQFIYFKSTAAAGFVSLAMPGHESPYALGSLAGSLLASLGGGEAEGRIYIGVFALLTIVGALIVKGNSRLDALNKSLMAYFVFFFLLSFGPANWLPDIFYAVPVLGMMHLYQRFCLFTVLPLVIAFAISVAIVRERLATSPSSPWWRTAVAVVLVACMVAACIFGKSSTPDVGFEILWLGLAAFALVIVESDLRFALICGACLSFPLVSVKSLFPRAHPEGQTPVVLFDPTNRQKIQTHLFSGDRKLVRVLDLTPELNDGFPKNTGWIFKSGDRRVFNFLGYELHLNASADYLDMMGGWFGMYNVAYARATGVDHIVWRTNETNELKRFLDSGFEIENTTEVGERTRISKVRDIQGGSPLGGVATEPVIFADGLVEVHGRNGEGSAQSRTDWARNIEIEADLPRGGRAYLNIWPLRHHRYYLDDKRVSADLDEVRRPTIDLPPGKSRVRVKVWSPYSTYLFYALLFALASWIGLGALEYWSRARLHRPGKLVTS